MLTRDRLLELTIYDPETGSLVWRVKKGRGVLGSEVGAISSTGYRQTIIDRKPYQVHRLIWFYMTGEWPTVHIDHINRNRADNRWCNLRLATASENVINSSIRADNKLGIRGVHWHKGAKSYYAKAHRDGICYSKGGFHCPLEAHQYYLKLAKELFGEFMPDAIV